MPKNIVVYSDGTGQDGGARPEQTLSNIYKMYRVSRVSPQTAIDPTKQVTMYDPGLGTDIQHADGLKPYRPDALKPVVEFAAYYSGEVHK